MTTNLESSTVRPTRNQTLQLIAGIGRDADAIVRLAVEYVIRERGLSDGYVPPASPREHELARICEDVLRVSGIGVNDTLFSVGADSLALMRVASKVRSVTGVTLPIDGLFDDPTVRGLAALIDAMAICAPVTGGSVQTPVAPMPMPRSLPVATSPASVVVAANVVVGVAGQNETLVLSRSTGQGRLVPNRVVAALERCATFRPLDAHVNACRDLLSTNPESELRGLLEAGMLVPWGAVAASDEGDASSPRVSTLLVPTRGRPEGLDRCLGSYLDNAEAHSHRLDVVVADDAPLEDNERARLALAAIGHRHGVRAEYVDLAARRAMASAVAHHAGVDEAVLRRAIGVDLTSHLSTSGSMRNTLLMNGSGGAGLMVDDDTVCRAAGHHRPSTQMVFRKRGAIRDTCVLRTHATTDGMWEDLEPVTADLCGEHERYLGRTLAHCAARAVDQPPSDLEATDVAFWEGASAHSTRVRVTTSGLAGDCGWGSPSEYLLAPPHWSARTTVPYDQLVQRRTVSRHADRPVCAMEVPDFMTTFFAVDLTDVCPPFLSLGRGADYVWANTWSLAGRDAAFVHLPFALSHQPVRPRRFWEGEITRSAAGTDLATVISALTRYVVAGGIAPGQTTAKGLASCGAALRYLADRPIQQFRRDAQEAVFRFIVDRMRSCEELLECCRDAPEGWRNDLDQYIGLLRSGLAREDYWVPLDLRFASDVPTSEQAIRTIVSDYAKTLEIWPSVMRACDELRSADGSVLAACGVRPVSPGDGRF